MLSEWKYEVVVERQPEINATANDRITYLYISYILNTYPQNYECEFICRSRKINYLF